MNKIELIDTYGNDTLHALSAWTSTSRDLTEDKIVRIPKLLKMLAENGHETPFEKSAIHFLIEVETASHIQLLKHRIAVSVNGESARYKEIKNLRHHIPLDWPDKWKNNLQEHTTRGQDLYHDCLNDLVQNFGFSRKRAKESARFFLGYNNVITMDVMFNFRSFMNFQRLRNEEGAQEEIHWFAEEMLKLVRGTGKFNASLDAFGY